MLHTNVKALDQLGHYDKIIFYAIKLYVYKGAKIPPLIKC
jgi:hypothetical protein